MTTSAYFSTLSPELQEIARANGENDEKIKANILSLSAWIKKSPHLKARTDERLLLAFLRRSQFNLEDAKRRIDAYYSLKSAFPEVLCEREVNESLMDLMKRGIHVIPQNPVSAAGPRLIISQYSKCDDKKYHPRQAFKLFFMLLEILALEDDNASLSGITYILDARDVTVEQMQQYYPFLLKKIWLLVDQALPVKFYEIHLINMRREGLSVFSFVKSFLPAKMPFKFIVHQKAEDLYEHLPRDAMTIEYGGHNGYAVCSIKAWLQKLAKYKTYFAEDKHFGTNEKRRVGGKNREELCSGLSGSFRKTEVD